eukprot:scaffold189307_cov31-Tisochrysis_lutea.AAC.2
MACSATHATARPRTIVQPAKASRALARVSPAARDPTRCCACPLPNAPRPTSTPMRRRRRTAP